MAREIYSPLRPQWDIDKSDLDSFPLLAEHIGYIEGTSLHDIAAETRALSTLSLPAGSPGEHGFLYRDANGNYSFPQVPVFDADDIPDLPADKITSGVFDSALIPLLADAQIPAGIARDNEIESWALIATETGNKDASLNSLTLWSEFEYRHALIEFVVPRGNLTQDRRQYGLYMNRDARPDRKDTWLQWSETNRQWQISRPGVRDTNTIGEIMIDHDIASEARAGNTTRWAKTKVPEDAVYLDPADYSLRAENDLMTLNSALNGFDLKTLNIVRTRSNPSLEYFSPVSAQVRGARSLNQGPGGRSDPIVLPSNLPDDTPIYVVIEGFVGRGVEVHNPPPDTFMTTAARWRNNMDRGTYARGNGGWAVGFGTSFGGGTVRQFLDASNPAGFRSLGSQLTVYWDDHVNTFLRRWNVASLDLSTYSNARLKLDLIIGATIPGVSFGNEILGSIEFDYAEMLTWQADNRRVIGGTNSFPIQHTISDLNQWHTGSAASQIAFVGKRRRFAYADYDSSASGDANATSFWIQLGRATPDVSVVDSNVLSANLPANMLRVGLIQQLPQSHSLNMNFSIEEMSLTYA